MEVLDYIFILSFLSIGYGENIYPECENEYDNVSIVTTSIPFNHTVKLAFSNHNNFLNLQTCYWRIKFDGSLHEIRIIFKELRLRDSFNCISEYLEIKFPEHHNEKNMKFCGTSYPKELQLRSFKDGYFDIVLYSIFILNDRDFNIVLKNDYLMTSKVSDLTVSDTPMYLYSPGYPDDYYMYMNMTWWFTAKDNTSRIVFEFLWLEMEEDCEYDFLEIKGDKTNFLTCGYESRFLVAANDSSVRMTFETDGYSEFDGFVLKYYTVPYPEYSESCVRGGLTLTAIPFIPQMLTVTKTNSKDCKWTIDTESTKHVIIFEVMSYFTSKFKCDQRLYITDTFYTQMISDYYNQYISPASLGGTLSNCINKAVQYYRSMTSSLVVELYDQTEAYSDVIGNMTFSYYSVPRDAYSNKVIHIGYKPSYIWLLKPKPGSDEPEILLKAKSGCIKLELIDQKLRSVTEDIGNHLEIYDGDSKEAQDLVNGCDENRNGSVISGTKSYMFIRVKHPTSLLLPNLLEITSTDQCQGFVQKIVLPSLSGSIKIYNPKYNLPIPQNLVCLYEVSASSDDAVLSIQGRSQQRVVTCNDKLDFFNSGRIIYSWCFTKDFIKETSVNKIRLILRTDDVYDSIRYSVTITEQIKPKTDVPPGQCSGRQTLRPQPGQDYTITSPNYPQDYPPDLDCEWLMIAPGGYDITVTINKAELFRDWSGCYDSLTLYSGKDAWIEFQVFEYCEYYSNIDDLGFVSESGYFLVKFKSDIRNSDTGFTITYSVKKVKSSANLPLTLRQQTFNFDSSWDISGSHLQRQFNTPSVYSNYRIVLFIDGVDSNFCKTVSISFTKVIMNADYYNQIYLCDTDQTSTVLYGPNGDVTMDIYVDKDYSSQPYALSVVYNLEKTPDCSSGRPLLLFAEYISNTFTSPNYPGHYSNNQYCQWKIQANEEYVLYLEVVFSELGSSSNANYRDYVTIFDGGDRYSRLLGKFTGSTRGVYKSTSNVLFIEFYSDATETNTGFKIKYRYEVPTTTSVSEPKSNYVAIVAGCVAGCIFLLVCCIVCGVCCKRKRIRRDRHDRDRSSSVIYNSSNNTVYVLGPVISNNTNTLPPPYSEIDHSALDNLGFTVSQSSSAPEDNDLPPPYSDLPSYENSQQYEIPNTRSLSSDSILVLNSTMISEISSSGQLDNHHDDVPRNQRYGSQDELYDNEHQFINLPSYENSQQYEIPNTRSLSSDSILNNTISEISISGQMDNHHDDVPRNQRYGSQDELYDNEHQLMGLDNPALSRSNSTIV